MVRTPSIATTSYAPTTVPTNPDELQRYLVTEFAKISAVINLLALGHLEKTTVTPAKPRDGDIRYADGVNWLPNGTGGVGVYYFKGATSTWVLLG